MITNKKEFFKEIIKSLLKLTIAGVFIGVLKKYDALIAVVLLLKTIHIIYKEIIKSKTTKNWLLLIGILLTCFGGIVGENWRVANVY